MTSLVSSTQPQVLYQFMNYGADSAGVATVIYITNNVSYNKLQLQISLNQGSVTLQPVSTIPDQPPPVSTTDNIFYLDFSPLQLTPTIFSGLTFSATGWQFKKITNTSVVAMAPTQQVVLGTGSNIQTITIGNMEIAQPPSHPTASLYPQAYNVFSQGSIVYGSLPVSFLNPPIPSDKSLWDYINISLPSTNILNSYEVSPAVPNQLTLTFSHGTFSTSVNANSGSKFNLSFVYGEASDPYGYGALTSVQNAQQITLSKGINASQWKVNPNLSAQTPSWDLIPVVNQPIVPNASGAVVSFTINNIVTTYQPGPTALILSSTGIKGYEDGVYVVVLTKVGHVILNNFQANPPISYMQNGKATVTLSWTIANATQLTLWQNQQPQTLGPTSTSTSVDLYAEQTSFALVAQGLLLDQGNSVTATTTAIAFPSINAFAGNPTEIFSGQSGHNANFSWAVDTVAGAGVVIRSTGSAFSGQSFPDAEGHTSALVTSPQMVTLSPVPGTVPNPLTLTRNLVFSAFTPTSKSYTLSGSIQAALASPTMPFVAFSDAANHQLVIANTVNFNADQTVSVGKQPAALGFSADGTVLVVANQGDKSLTPIQVSFTEGTLTFTPQSPISLSGTPYGLYITPDAKYIYVALDEGSSAAGQLVALEQSGGTYSLFSTVTVGNAPRGLTLPSAGGVIYVANSQSNTISIVAINPTTGTLQVSGTTINNVTGNPTDLVAVDPNKLVVTCPTSNHVVVIDMQNPNLGTRNTITVGNNPTRLAVTPSQAYAFVTNTNDGTLSMLDCWGLVSQVAVVGTPIGVGSNPGSITVTPDGLTVLLANSGSANCNVVTLNTYATSNVVSIGSQMTNAAVSPDGTLVFVWQNLFRGYNTTPGIVAYTVSSGTQQAILASDSVIGCVFSPNPSLHTAYALTYKSTQLSVINTKTLATSSVALPLLGTTDIPLALAISGDGNTLFVAYADPSNNIALLVLTYQQGSWQSLTTVPLYQASRLGALLLAATLDGTSIFIGDSTQQGLYVVNQVQGQYHLNSKTVPITAAAVKIVVLPNGAKAFVLNSQGMEHDITVVDVATLQSQLLSIPQKFVALSGLTSSPDSRYLFASDANSAALRILDPASLRVLQTISLSTGGASIQNPIDVAMSSDGSTVYVVNNISNNMSIISQIPM